MRANVFNGLTLRNVLLVGLFAGVGAAAGAMAGPASAGITADGPTQTELSLEAPMTAETRSLETPLLEIQTLESVALEADSLEAEALGVEVPEELEDLREMGREIGDRLSEIDPEVIKQVMRPLGRQALQIFLDSAPGLSQKAIELGEQGLAELEKRAREGLERAQEDFDPDELVESGL